MRELTTDEKTFLEELLANVKEVEKLVWDDDLPPQNSTS
jgi:hypothetical protein